MVSTIPTWSGKNIGKRISRNLVPVVLLVAVLFAVLLVSYPWLTMSGVVIAYILTFPFSWQNYKKQSASD